MLGIHLADLHLGKRLKEFPLLEEQQAALDQVVDFCEAKKVDFVIIAGDIFDKGVPVIEALDMFDDFLHRLSQLKVEVFALGGNHDSAERLSFLSGFLKYHHIHLITQYKGQVEKRLLDKEGERVAFYMLPFIKPADVRRYLPEEERTAITSYHTAMAAALKTVELDPDTTNILVAHQFVTGSLRCDSEEVSVGGLDNIGAELMKDFDYVALGHIHSPQNIKNYDYMRYSGTPLKYSFSECNQIKSMTVLEISAGQVKISTEPFKLLRDLYMLKGTFAELRELSLVKKHEDSYVDITLTDEKEILNVLSTMRQLYPRLCHLSYENSRTANINNPASVTVTQSPMELLSDFFEQRTGHSLTQEQSQFLEELLEKGRVE